MSADFTDARSVYEFTVKTIDGEEISMEIYKGLVLLIVNVASRCGFTTNNYKELVQLDTMYRDRGLRILAFPCNQFFHQEPDEKEGIVCFAKGKNASFDFFDKIEVNGRNAHPLFKYLKTAQRGTLTSGIKWNFTKFIVDRAGKPVERHAPYVPPLSLCKSLEVYLAESPPRGSGTSKSSRSSKKAREKKTKQEQVKRDILESRYERRLEDRETNKKEERDHDAMRDIHMLNT